jgi:hypothetical protein
MEYKGVEFSVVQMVDSGNWRWEIKVDGGKTRTGLSQAGRAAAIKLAQHQIDRILDDKT